MRKAVIAILVLMMSCASLSPYAEARKKCDNKIVPLVNKQVAIEELEKRDACIKELQAIVDKDATPRWQVVVSHSLYVGFPIALWILLH